MIRMREPPSSSPTTIRSPPTSARKWPRSHTEARTSGRVTLPELTLSLDSRIRVIQSGGRTLGGCTDSRGVRSDERVAFQGTDSPLVQGRHSHRVLGQCRQPPVAPATTTRNHLAASEGTTSAQTFAPDLDFILVPPVALRKGQGNGGPQESGLWPATGHRLAVRPNLGQ